MSQFFSQVLLTLGTRVLTVFLGFASSVFIARTLGPAGQGMYSVALSYASLLVLLCLLGLNASTVVNVGKNIHPIKAIFGNNLLFALALGGIAISVGSLIVLFDQALFPGVSRALLLGALLVIPFSLFVNFGSHILIGSSRFVSYNMAFAVQSVLFFLAVIFLSVSSLASTLLIISVYVVSFIAAAVAIFGAVWRVAGGISLRFHKVYAKELFGYGLRVHIANIFGFAQTRFPLFFVNALLGSAYAGWYAVSLTITEGMGLLANAVSTVLLSRVASSRGSESRELTLMASRMILLCTTMGAIAFWVFGEVIVNVVYSSVFLEAIDPLRVLVVSGIASSGWIVLSSDLTARGKASVVARIAGMGAVGGIGLSVALVPPFGLMGAAYALVISQWAIFLTLAVVYSGITGARMRDALFFRWSDAKVLGSLLAGGLKNRL